MYGAQTIKDEIGDVLEFENDVEMYGAQTSQLPFLHFLGLRMM